MEDSENKKRDDAGHQFDDTLHRMLETPPKPKKKKEDKKKAAK